VRSKGLIGPKAGLRVVFSHGQDERIAVRPRLNESVGGRVIDPIW